jgi:hypothetical protein
MQNPHLIILWYKSFQAALVFIKGHVASVEGHVLCQPRGRVFFKFFGWGETESTWYVGQ